MHCLQSLVFGNYRSTRLISVWEMCQKPCVLSTCKLLIHGRNKAALGVCQKQMVLAHEDPSLAQCNIEMLLFEQRYGLWSGVGFRQVGSRA
jgi:hypothetical protein